MSIGYSDLQILEVVGYSRLAGLPQRDGRSYWILPLADFMATWQYPETSATIKPSQVDPSIHEEAVTRWALVMTKG